MQDRYLSGTAPGIDYVPAHERPDQELYHSHSWWTTYVFSQDAKYIGIQYALTAIGTGLIGLVLSWMMRIQLAFPGLGDSRTFGILSIHYHARNDYGNLFAHRTISRRVWKSSYSTHVWSSRYGFPLCKYD